MTLDEVVGFHAKFRVRLRAFITAPEGSVPDSILRDDVCPLGQWLRSQEGQQFAAHAEYTTLVVCHKQLHLAATRAATKAVEGDQSGALNMLETGEFATRSKDIMQAIVAFRRLVNKHMDSKQK